LADLETDRKADPIYSFDPSGHTIYVKSFSKLMLPGLRLAAAVLPKALIETFRMYKSSCDSSTAALSQAALELYLNSGMYEHHVTRIRDKYRARMEALRTACGIHLSSELVISVPEGGIFARLTFPGRVSVEAVTASLLQHNVHVFPTVRCYLPSFPKDNGIRISIIRTSETQIDQGVRLINDAAGQLLNRADSLRSGPVINWI
jgi:DNA-binding transcriptional MocR family regulator